MAIGHSVSRVHDVRLSEGPPTGVAGREWASGEGAPHELLLTRSGRLSIVRQTGPASTVLAEETSGPHFDRITLTLTVRVFGFREYPLRQPHGYLDRRTLAPFGAGVGMRVQAGVTAEFDNLVIIGRENGAAP